MGWGGVVGDLVGRVGTWGCDGEGIGHGDLVDVAPEGSEGQVETAAVVDEEEVWVYQVVGWGGGDAEAAVVEPGSWVHGEGGGDADGAVLGSAD